MANAIYPIYKQALLDGLTDIDLNDGTVKVALVGTAQTIANTTVTNGLFDGDNVTYTAVSGATVEALVIYIDTGVSTTSRLVAYIDTGVTGLPVTPNGGDITVTWNASGIFQL